MKKTPSARSSRRAASRTSAANLVLIVLLLLMVNYLGFKYYAHKDLSSSQFYALSPKTKDILRNLPAPVHVISMLIDNQNGAYWDESLNLLKEYERVAKGKLTLERVDPVSDRARAVELQNQLHFAGTDNIFIFEYKDPKAPADVPSRNQIVKLDELLDQNPMTGQVGGYKGEQQFTSAIVSIEEGKPSKVYFTAGHGEHPFGDSNTPNGYGMVAGLLKGENLTVTSLNLAATGEVPPDAQAVIIAGPTVPFSATEAQALDKYLAANGKVMLLLDPLAQSGLDSVISKYELSFQNDIVLTRYMSGGGSIATTPQAIIQQSGFSNHPITAKFPAANYQLVVLDTRSIHIQPDSSPSPRAQALMSTGAEAWGWAMKDKMTEADLMSVGTRTFDPKVDIPGPVSIAAAYDAGPVTDPKTKEQSNGTRVVAVGSAHFLENDAVSGQPVAADFFINAVDWLAKKNATLDISPKLPQSYGLSLSPMSERTVMWTALLFVPLVALVLGIFAWLSRRK